MEVCFNVNHSLANGSLVWRSFVFKDTFFSVVVEKLAVAKSRLTDTGTACWLTG